MSWIRTMILEVEAYSLRISFSCLPVNFALTAPYTQKLRFISQLKTKTKHIFYLLKSLFILQPFTDKLNNVIWPKMDAFQWQERGCGYPVCVSVCLSLSNRYHMLQSCERPVDWRLCGCTHFLLRFPEACVAHRRLKSVRSMFKSVNSSACHTYFSGGFWTHFLLGPCCFAFVSFSWLIWRIEAGSEPSRP